MAVQESLTAGSSWFFTAPWEPLVRRRGDALGLRELSDFYSDTLAPGLSNAAYDARWVTILGWSLRASHSVWEAAGGGNLRTRDGQRQRYAWLRPLELLWVTWGLQLDDGEPRQLPGRRRVTRWLANECREARFAMSPDQFRRYRQTGIYAAYRSLLRSAPGLTGREGPGDGWTPGPVAQELFRYVNSKLPRNLRFGNAKLERTKWGSWSEQEENWWLSRGWNAGAKPGDHLAPTAHGIIARLPDEERRILSPSLFQEGHRRRIVADVLARIGPALTHAELCDHLAGAKELRDLPLAALPAFTRLADAGTDAVSAIWSAIGASTETRGPVVTDLTGDRAVQEALERLREASAVWHAQTSQPAVPGSIAAAALAEEQQRASSTADGLRSVIRHHERYGGGLRWFQLLQRQDRVEPLLPQRDLAASRHRFRLWPLARLAHQCGVAKLENALEAAGRADVELDEEEGR